MYFRSTLKMLLTALLLLLSQGLASGEPVHPAGALPDDSLFGSNTPALNRIQDAEPVKARAGWIQHPGWAELSENGYRAGYTFDILDRLAKNGNIALEYVEAKDRNELEKLMSTGEIDLSADFDPEDSIEGMEFLKQSIGPEIQMICAREGDSRFFENELSTFDGKTLALTNRPSVRHSTEDFEKAWGFSTSKRYYKTLLDVKTALHTGSVDLVVVDSYSYTDDLVVIAKYGLSDRRLAVRKDRSDLKQALMTGFAVSLLDAPFFLQKLSEKYFPPIEDTIAAFSKQEYDFIQEVRSIDVYFHNEIPMVSLKQDGKFTGYFPSLLNWLAQRSGLQFNFIGCDSFREIEAIVQADSSGRSIGILPQTRHYMANDKLVFSNSSITSAVMLLTRKDMDRNVISVAYPEDGYSRQDLAAENGFLGRIYKDDDASLKAVLKGEVDAALIKSYKVQNFMSRRKYLKSLTVMADHAMDYPISIVLPACADKALLSIMNKISSNFSGDDLSNSLNRTMTLSYKGLTLVETMQDNWFLILLIMLVFTAGIGIIILQQRFNRKLEIINKNKDVFLADMSHDFRTPLTAISGFAYLGKSESDPRYYPEIITSAAYMQELVNDILNIRQYSEGKAIELQPEPVIADTLYDSILSVMHGRAAAKNITIHFDSKISYPYISVDPMRIRQVFVNIIGNAVKYSPSGSSIEVTVEDYMKSHTARVKAVITDHGEGMSKEFIRQRIFHPFEREKNAFSAKEGGSGLGLAITKIIMDRMGGTIGVESELGKGSTFTLDFPVATITKEEYEQKHTEEPVLESKEFDFSGVRVLLCEDNEVNTFIVSNILQKRGCIVDCATDGKSGLEKFEQSPARYYSAILMDIRMPVMDGIEAAKAIRALNRADAQQVPIIALSANAFEEDKMASAKAGMNAHLAKPVNVDALFRTMEQLLNVF